MHYLYKITNQLSQKIYIGQSNKETERWRQHKYFARQEKPAQYIHRAMAKYGFENFVYEIIAMCVSPEDANETEKELIKQYDSRNPKKGYNVAPGGETPWNLGLPKELNPLTGIPRSEEIKKKISESSIGKLMPPCSDERKEYMSNLYLGRTLPAEWVNKIADSNRGQTRSDESKLKMSIAHMGQVLSDETKLKMSKAHIGKHTGENNPKSKLTWEIVNLIRAEFSSTKISQSKIAKKYNVSQGNISDIINNKIWIKNDKYTTNDSWVPREG